MYLQYLLAEIIQPSSLFQCKALFFVLLTGRNASFCWAVLFSHALLKIIETNDFVLVKSLMKYYIAFSTFVPIISSFTPWSTTLVIYDEDKQQCGRYEYINSFDYVYFIFSGLPMIICCMLSIYFYIRISCHLKTLFSTVKTQNLLAFMIYPAIMLICWLPSLIWTIGAGITTVDDTFTGVARICRESQGFMNALVYGLSSRTREEIKALFEKNKAQPDPTPDPTNTSIELN